MVDQENENWTKCSRCGSPVLITPETHQLEACSVCATQSSQTSLFMGLTFFVIAAVVVSAIVYFCVQLLAGS